MKRKSMVLLLVVCVILPTALSAAVVDLSLGATAQYKMGIDDDSFFDGMGDFKNYTLGADLRVKFLIAEVDVVGTFGNYVDSSSNEYTEISTLTTAGVSMDLLGIARLGFGLGPRFRVLIDDAGNTKIISADNNEIASWENFGDTFIDSPVAFRTTVDFNLGNIMLGLNYTLDTEYTFNNAAEVDKLFSANIDEGKVGVSLLFSIF